MSFIYVNEGYKNLFNLIKQSDGVTQIESSIYNPESNVSCSSTTLFGYNVGEDIAEVYGKFSFYVDTSKPSNSLLKLSFQNGLNASAICCLEAYPSDASLTNGYFPFKLVLGNQNLYAPLSSETRQCASVNAFNTVWFHIRLSSTKSSIFEIRFDNNPVFSYNFISSYTSLGQIICFDLSDNVYLSNIIMSSDEVTPTDKIIPLSKTFVSGTAESTENGYLFTSGKNVKFSLSNPDIPQDYETYVSKIVCRATNVEAVGADDFESLKFRDAAVSSDYTAVSIPAVGDFQSFIINVDQISMNTNVTIHSAEILLE